jgi:hypothetical protein
MRKIDVTDSYQPLSSGKLVASVTISTPPGNSASVTFKDAAGNEVGWISGEWHDFHSIDLSEIQVKGTPGDTVTIIGGVLVMGYSASDNTGAAGTENEDVATAINLALLGFRLAAQGSLSVQGMVDGIIDEFEDETGVDGAASTGEVYDAMGDLYENNSTPGADFATGGSASASCIYGAGYEAIKAFDDSNATAWVGAPGVTAGWIQYDLGDGNSDTLYKCTITARSTYANGSPKDFTIQGSNNGTDWDTLKTVTGETGWTPNEKREFVVDDDTAYRYFRIDIATVDGASNMNIAEIEFIDAAVLYDMTLISEDFTADEAPDEVSLVCLLKPPASYTLNTDVKAWVSQDGGATWEQATLTLEGDYGSDVKIFTTNHELAATDGTSMKWKITTYNNKAFEIHGVSLSWR